MNVFMLENSRNYNTTMATKKLNTITNNGCCGMNKFRVSNNIIGIE